jgi:hypothetical protein
MSEANTRHLSPERPSGPPSPESARAGGDQPRRRGPGILAIIMLGLACFALAAAALLRFYVSEQLTLAPRDVYSTNRLVAQNASYFDASTGRPVSGATLTLIGTVRGNVNASTDEVAVWDTGTVMEDIPNRKRIEIGQFRLAFDRENAALVNCCGSTAKPGRGEPAMYGSFFPFGMERRTYNVYDSQTNRAWPMQFEGTDTVDGMEVYRYVQRIDQTNTGPAPANLPSTLLGLPGPVRQVPADSWYGSTVTTWIEPRSGVVVDRRQTISTSIRGRDGQGEMVTGEMDLRMSPEDRRELADQASSAASTLLWLRTVGPVAALIVGLALLAVGVVRVTRGRGRGRRTLIEDPV